jgi:DNA-binding GntR family transcriptional regulator
VLGWRRAGPGAAAQRRASAELRAAVLPAAAAASARHADGTEVDRLVALTADLRLGPPTRLLTTHGAVLRLVLVTSRNDLIAATAAAVLPGPADPDRVAALGRTGVLDRHDALAAAVAARDPEAARRAMTALVAATDGLA